MWNPQHINVAVGDSVTWSWTGSIFGPKRNVAQVVVIELPYLLVSSSGYYKFHVEN